MGNSGSNDLSNQINRSNDKIKNDLQNSLAQTARGVNRTNRAVEKSVAKTNNEINKTFSKANMEQFDDGLVTVLKDSGKILGEITKVGDQVLNNPATQLLGGIPIVGEGLGALRAINTGLKAGSKLSTGLGDISDRKNYDGKGGIDVTKNVLEKSIQTGKNVADTGITFA